MLPQPVLKPTVWATSLLSPLSLWMLQESLRSPEKAESTPKPGPTAVMSDSWKAADKDAPCNKDSFYGPQGT